MANQEPPAKQGLQLVGPGKQWLADGVVFYLDAAQHLVAQNSVASFYVAPNQYTIFDDGTVTLSIHEADQLSRNFAPERFLAIRPPQQPATIEQSNNQDNASPKPATKATKKVKAGTGEKRGQYSNLPKFTQATLPTNYKEEADKVFRCPVRGCEKSFTSPDTLARHMCREVDEGNTSSEQSGHNRQLMMDMLDGTFEQRGTVTAATPAPNGSFDYEVGPVVQNWLAPGLANYQIDTTTGRRIPVPNQYQKAAHAVAIKLAKFKHKYPYEYEIRALTQKPNLKKMWNPFKVCITDASCPPGTDPLTGRDAEDAQSRPTTSSSPPTRPATSPPIAQQPLPPFTPPRQNFPRPSCHSSTQPQQPWFSIFSRRAPTLATGSSTPGGYRLMQFSGNSLQRFHPDLYRAVFQGWLWDGTIAAITQCTLVVFTDGVLARWTDEQLVHFVADADIISCVRGEWMRLVANSNTIVGPSETSLNARGAEGGLSANTRDMNQTVLSAMNQPSPFTTMSPPFRGMSSPAPGTNTLGSTTQRVPNQETQTNNQTPYGIQQPDNGSWSFSERTRHSDSSYTDRWTDGVEAYHADGNVSYRFPDSTAIVYAADGTVRTTGRRFGTQIFATRAEFDALIAREWNGWMYLPRPRPDGE
jgi:hypothetical protein